MSDAAVQIDKISAETIRVPIVGTAPPSRPRRGRSARITFGVFLPAKQQMLDAQQDPQADYEASLYRTDSGYGFPVLGFKSAIVGAARFYGKSVTMTALRQMLFMTGEMSKDRSQLLVPINGEPKMREDMVRVGMGTDLRYRAEFIEWSAVLTITYVRSALSQSSVLSLVDAAGLGCGVGEWRPERRGQNGTFRIDTDAEIEVLAR